MCSSLLSVWRLDSVIKRKTSLKYSPPCRTCPNMLDLPGPDHSGACSGCGRRTHRFSVHQQNLHPGSTVLNHFGDILLHSERHVHGGDAESQRQEKEQRKPTTAEELWRKPAELMLRKHRCAFTSGSLTSSERPRHAGIQNDPRINS